MWLTFWTLALFFHQCLTLGSRYNQEHEWRAQESQRGVHLPLFPSPRGPSPIKRGVSRVAGLGDCLDASYSVLIDIGGISTSVLLDTGSSDLWVVADSCTAARDAHVPLYPQSSVNSTGFDVSLLYGDSGTGTYAYGIIGNSNVNLAGLEVPGQQFALINRTNAGVIDSGSSGIFGLGFPVNSVLWNTIFVERYLNSNSSAQQSHRKFLGPRRTIWNQRYPSFPNLGLRQSHFPDLGFLDSDTLDEEHPSARAAAALSDKMFQSYAEIAPFIGRLIANKEIDPLFTIALQRDTVEIGGNAGQLSLGALPPGVEYGSLTWVPVRGYTRNQGGLPAPLDSPGEVYPISWEIPIDDVFLDGVILPRSNLSSSTISLSALIDTGNSLIRGPEDVVAEIDRRVGTSFPCAEAHTIAFSIGGKLFPVDPRDFVFQEYTNSVLKCTGNIAATDPPAVGGYLFSWSLGTPFLKGVISAFYFGDLEYPSRDPPRIGLISTVPQDAAQRLKAAVDAAKARDGNFPLTSEAAPSGTVGPMTTYTNVAAPTQSEDVFDTPDQTASARKYYPQWIPRLVVLVIILYSLL